MEVETGNSSDESIELGGNIVTTTVHQRGVIYNFNGSAWWENTS